MSRRKGGFTNKNEVIETKTFFAIIRAGTIFQNITISPCHIGLPQPTNPISFDVVKHKESKTPCLNLQLYGDF